MHTREDWPHFASLRTGLVQMGDTSTWGENKSFRSCLHIRVLNFAIFASFLSHCIITYWWSLGSKGEQNWLWSGPAVRTQSFTLPVVQSVRTRSFYCSVTVRSI